jgi:hypothetical protein
MKPEDLVGRCLETHLDCIAVTDHNTIAGALEVQRLASFRVIIGEEIKSEGGEIIGLFLKEAIPRGLSSLETVWRIKDQGGLVSVPHPFDHFRRSVIQRDALDEILPYVDIVEAFNARNTLRMDNRKALDLASNHGILVSAVSDSHTLFEVGRTYTEMPDFDGTSSGFRRSLSQANLVERQVTPLIHFLTTLTKSRQRLASLWH